MRPILFPLLSIVLCLAALILTLLCIFAGHSRGFMEDYSIVTLNTSRIGQNIFNTSESSSSDNPFESFIHNITDSIESQIEEEFSSFAKDLGLHDWYSAHLLTYCEGNYIPGPVPNATLSRSSIHKNVTYCSNETYAFDFNLTQVLQRELNNSGHSNIDLSDLHFPAAISEGLSALRSLAHVTYVFYILTVALTGAVILVDIVGMCTVGRISALLIAFAHFLVCIVAVVPFAIVTWLGSKAARMVNKYGNSIGVSAKRGNGFLALTWAAEGLLLVATIAWVVIVIRGDRRDKVNEKTSQKANHRWLGRARRR